MHYLFYAFPQLKHVLYIYYAQHVHMCIHNIYFIVKQFQKAYTPLFLKRELQAIAFRHLASALRACRGSSRQLLAILSRGTVQGVLNLLQISILILYVTQTVV